ncbi:hypothetical protein ABZ865_05880 [Streptomyces sp. NPDC047085]|uniref:hypothetical protein n=1 Tax=Streptomyces sp. NPDC047085 TaxID=3155140 RepID=UPI0033E11A9E
MQVVGPRITSDDGDLILVWRQEVISLATEGDQAKRSPRTGSGSHLLGRRCLMKTKQSRAELAGVLLVLLLTASVAAWWGIEDFSEALDFPGRITGAALIAVSIITLLGAVAVVDHWGQGTIPHSGLVALISTVVAFLVNTMLLLQVSLDGERIRYPVLLGLLAVGSVFAALMVWRTLGEIPAPKRVAAALIVSTVIAIANFSYQNLYQPFHRGIQPLVSLTPGKPVLRQDRKEFAVPVDIRIVNSSDVGFYVLGTEFHAMGEKVGVSDSARPPGKWRDDAEQWSKYQEKHPLSRTEAYQPGQLVAAKPWIPAGHWIEASDEFVVRTVVQLPIGTPYDHLTFYATASLARKDRLGVDKFGQTEYSWKGAELPQWVKSGRGDQDTLAYKARLEENNAIDRHTRERRYVTVYWRFGPHGVDVSEVIAREGEEGREFPEPTNREVRRRYGLVDVLAGPIELPLWDIKGRR